MWDHLCKLPTKLGAAAASGTKHVSPEELSSKVRGDDLLPICVEAVESHLSRESEGVVKGAKLVFTVFNFLWTGGLDGRRKKVVTISKLTVSQKLSVAHVVERLKDLFSVEHACPDFESAKRMLVDSKFDYSGEPIMAMEELEASKVLPVWPRVGEAAVQDVVDYLPDDLKMKIEDPSLCLLPPWEWPLRPPQSRVRATPTEWEQIVRGAYARGLMVGVRSDEVFTDTNGNKVLNGAGAVRKLKVVGGETKAYQRFISNFIPINAYQQHLTGGDKHLPYLGQLTLLEQGDDEFWVTDSEDFTSCFNLFRLPRAWHRYMCFGMAVDGAILGGASGRCCTPQWRWCRWAGWMPFQWSSQLSGAWCLMKPEYQLTARCQSCGIFPTLMTWRWSTLTAMTSCVGWTRPALRSWEDLHQAGMRSSLRCVKRRDYPSTPENEWCHRWEARYRVESCRETSDGTSFQVTSSSTCWDCQDASWALRRGESLTSGTSWESQYLAAASDDLSFQSSKSSSISLGRSSPAGAHFLQQVMLWTKSSWWASLCLSWEPPSRSSSTSRFTVQMLHPPEEE